MISGLVDGLFAALVALLVAMGLAAGPQHDAVVLGAPTAPETPVAAAVATPAGAGSAGVSAEIDSYLEQIHMPLSDLQDSFDSMSKLMQAPYVTDDGWRKDAAAAFDGIQTAHQALLQLEPPASLAEVDKALIAGTEKCSQGAEVARKSIEEDSVVGLYAAAQLMKACGQGVTKASTMLTQMQE